MTVIMPVAALLLAACSGDPAIDALHRTADSLMAERPDSALLLLNTHGPIPPSSGEEGQGWWGTHSSSRRQLMRHELLRARAMNKAYVNFTTDSVMKLVADYYDSHGTPNERMEAHYLLGCTYRDMGEAPRAVDCYLDAIACADTVAADCDFWMMASIYGQMATIYHKQLLLTNEIDAHRKASYYNCIAKDTLYAILEQQMVAGVYILQNKRDSAEAVLLQVMNDYHEKGLYQEELQASTMLMSLYSEQPDRSADLKRLVDIYDEKSGLFDEHHELPPDRRLFYCYKARYFESINQLDSAEYYYRKMHQGNMLFTSQNSMYKGLLSIFNKRGKADSIAKYANLYCAVNDSSISVKDQELTAHISASYNYNRYQRQAFQNEVKAYKTRLVLVLVVVFMLSAFITIYILWRRYKARRRLEQEELKRQQMAKQQEMERLKAEFADVMERYNKNKKTLQLLEKSHQEVIIATQERLDNAQLIIDEVNEINQKYEESIALFRNENEALKEKIEELSRQQTISALLEKSMNFAGEPAVKRMLELADSPKLHICKREWEDYLCTVGDYYPELLKNLKETPDVTTQEIYTAILVILNMRTDDIARLIKVSGQRVTNIKSNLNFILFGVKSARPLFENLTNRYSIFLFEK